MHTSELQKHYEDWGAALRCSRRLSWLAGLLNLTASVLFFIHGSYFLVGWSTGIAISLTFFCEKMYRKGVKRLTMSRMGIPMDEEYSRH